MLLRTLILTFVIPLMVSFVHAKSVVVSGYGAIVANDVASARTQALDDAKRVAVEQLFGSYISAKTQTENFMLASEKIYSTATGRIDSYEITQEGRFDEDTFKVEIVANVDQNQVKQLVDQQLEKYRWLKKPRIKFAFSGPQDPLTISFNSTLAEKLKRAGFSVIDGKGDASIDASFTINTSLQSHISQQEYQGMQIASNQLITSAQVTAAQTGIVMSSISESASKAGNNSLKVMQSMMTDLSHKISQRIHMDINQAWTKPVSFPISLNVITTHDAAGDAIALLRERIVGIAASSIEHKTDGLERYLVEYNGWPEQFIEQLMFVTRQSDFPFEIKKIQGATVELNAK